MKTCMPPEPATACDQLAEVGPVLERTEDAPELLALGELGGRHHVEQAVAEELLDERPRRTRAWSGAIRSATCPDELVGARHRRSNLASVASISASGPVGEQAVQARGAASSVCLVDGRVEGEQDLLDRPSRRTRMRLASRSWIATRSTRRTRAARGLAGRGQPGGVGQAGQRRGGEAEPLLAGELHLAELVADHELLDRAQRGALDERLT